MIKSYLREVIAKYWYNNRYKHYAQIKPIIEKNQVTIFQKTYLNKLLLHAYNNVPYYRNIFKEIGVIRNHKVDLSKFCEIPVLTKDIIKRNQNELISKDYIKREYNWNSTGGSTGEPTKFIQDEEYKQWGDVAGNYYYKDVLGIDLARAKTAILWGSERDLIQGGFGWRAEISNWFTNTLFLNSFKMTEKDMICYIKTLNSFRPDLIRGYASSLYELSKYADREKLKLFVPRLIISSAETLSNEMRREIEKVFGTKVYNFYGSRETNNLAGECKEGLMHILSFHNYVEILDDDNQHVNEGEEGRVVVTNLHNYAMPFIRCEIGDMAILGPIKCICGCPLPTIRTVTGRSSEVLLSTNGEKITPCFVPFLFYPDCIDSTFGIDQYQKIKQFQVIQDSKEKILINIVKAKEASEDEFDYILQNFKKYLGTDMDIKISFVNFIPTHLSGKRTYVISNINKAKVDTNVR